MVKNAPQGAHCYYLKNVFLIKSKQFNHVFPFENPISLQLPLADKEMLSTEKLSSRQVP
jgi:hypothetical protein